MLGLGLGFFWCPWSWPRPQAFCPRLHFCFNSVQNVIEMELKLLLFAHNRKNCPSTGGFAQQAPSVTRLSRISLFHTGPKINNFCAEKFTFGSSPLLQVKSWLRFWLHSLLQTYFSSDYIGMIRNELTLPGLYLFFSDMNAKLLK